MDVRCERCRAQYVLDDGQVTPSGLAVRCTNCGHLFKVKKKELVVTVAMKPGEAEGIPLSALGAPRPTRPPVAHPPPGAAAPPAPQPDPAPVLPPPVHEVDLGPDEGMMAPPRSRTARRSLVAALAVTAAAAATAGAFVTARARASRPPPRVAGAASASAEAKAERPAEPQVVVTEEPRPPPEAAVPVPGPEPEVEAVRSAPEPVVLPASAPARPRGPKALLAQAGKLREKGDVPSALQLYGLLAAQDPANAEALTGRGLCYLDLDRYAPAQASFEAALQIEPRHPDALLGLAEAYRFEGRKSEAIRQYERYLAAHPAGDEAEVARNAITELKE